MLRLGLCCQFAIEPIKFKTTTATHMQKFGRAEQLRKLSDLCLTNAHSLLKAIEYCGAHHIGCFRINSQFWPVKTHPGVGYNFNDLPETLEIQQVLAQCQRRSTALNVRLSFHPDQFVLLSSPKEDIVRNSIAELTYQAEVSALIGAGCY
jgi:UV DNA damage endonuclease